MSHHVFVYGTLRGQEGAVKARLTGVRKDDTGGFPTLLPDESGEVEGEMFVVDDANLAHLDRIESEGRLYHRIDAGPEETTVWVYVGDTDKLRSQGDWTFDKDEIQQYFDEHVEVESQ